MESYSENFLRTAAGSVVALLVLFILRRSANDTRVFPPGPPRRPLVGNLKDIPSKGYEWEAYRELCKRCGTCPTHYGFTISAQAYVLGSDIVYLSALGSKLLVLSSFEAARDLLDRKGAIYSSRPRLVMIKEL